MQHSIKKFDYSETFWPTPRYNWHNVIAPEEWPNFLQKLVELTYNWRYSADPISLNARLFELIGWNLSEYPRLKSVLVDARYFQKRDMLRRLLSSKNLWEHRAMLGAMVSIVMSWAYSQKRFLMFHEIIDIDCYYHPYNFDEQDPLECHLAKRLFKPIHPSSWVFPEKNKESLLDYCKMNLKNQLIYSHEEIEGILNRGFSSIY